MENEIEKLMNAITKTAVDLPAGSLWRDLRAETGSNNGVEWLLLYENDPTAILKPYACLLYVKVIILTQEGRKYAESGQSEILHKCNLRQFETAWFCRALAIAMTEWDADHASDSSSTDKY